VRSFDVFSTLSSPTTPDRTVHGIDSFRLDYTAFTEAA
jgi:hypothetical protein